MLSVTHYIEFLDSSGSPLLVPQRYQPYFPEETRTFDGLTYQFSPYSIAGDISTDGSESGDHELIAPANMISGAKLWQASEDSCLIKVLMVLLTGTPPQDENSVPTWSELNFLSSSIFVCDTFSYSDAIPGEEDDENSFSPVTLRLTNPLNFVAGIAPTRRLTAAQVGPLPSSGGITF
jgi:hypothetical protein